MRGLIIFIVVFFTNIYANSNPLNYLNSIREKIGLIDFKSNNNLSQAAYNHSEYMKLNNKIGHIEIEGDEGFSGKTPSDRVIYARYYSKIVSENISWGTKTYEESIDNLLSAIYHRFTFLTTSKDEIGLGKNDIFYTYDLGNSILNRLCKETEKNINGSYYKICNDQNKKISKDDYEKALNSIKSQSAPIIFWPSENAINIPPVFYEESPDPLPYYSVSGYPISVEFNDYFYKQAPTLQSMNIEDSNGKILDEIVLMNKDNDPNDKFNNFQYALFPKKRLDWGSKYYVNLSYEDANGTHNKRWCFSTKSLESDKFYKIENNKDVTLKIIPNKSYSIYIVPKDGNDELGTISYSSKLDLTFIDKNTIKIKTNANIGTTLNIKADNKQKIKFLVSNSDNASTPKNEKCDNSNKQGNLNENNSSKDNSNKENPSANDFNNSQNDSYKEKVSVGNSEMTIISDSNITKNSNSYNLANSLELIINKITESFNIVKNNIKLFKNIPTNNAFIRKESNILIINMELPETWEY